MSAADWGGLAVLVGWAIWSIACAAATRIALTAAAKRFMKAPHSWAVAASYVALPVIFFGSLYLHEAVFGPLAIYGGSGLGMIAYVLAPFGLPLLVGGYLFLIIDLGRTALTDFARGHNA